MSLTKRATAEFFGTFWLVFGGCGSAVLAAEFPNLGLGFLGVALTFGLTLLTMAFTIGPISGCHHHCPSGGRYRGVECPLCNREREGGIHTGCRICGEWVWRTFAWWVFLLACLVAEVVLTMFFLLIILGSTDERAPKGFAPIAIGLSLTLIHLISIPVTNTSVNPARSTGPALFVRGWALGQLWLFWLAPIVGAALAGVIYHGLFAEGPQETVRAAERAR